MYSQTSRTAPDPPASLGDVVRGTLHLMPGIRGRKREPNTTHDDDVSQIVADVGDVPRIDRAIGQDLVENRNLLDVTLINIGEFALAGPFVGCGRDPATDKSGFDVVPMHPLQRDAVLRIEALGFHHPAGGIRHVVELAVREHAVHVHQEQLYTGGKLLRTYN